MKLNFILERIFDERFDKSIIHLNIFKSAYYKTVFIGNFQIV